MHIMYITKMSTSNKKITLLSLASLRAYSMAQASEWLRVRLPSNSASTLSAQSRLELLTAFSSSASFCRSFNILSFLTNGKPQYSGDRSSTEAYIFVCCLMWTRLWRVSNRGLRADGCELRIVDDTDDDDVGLIMTEPSLLPPVFNEASFNIAQGLMARQELLSKSAHDEVGERFAKALVESDDDCCCNKLVVVVIVVVASVVVVAVTIVAVISIDDTLVSLFCSLDTKISLSSGMTLRGSRGSLTIMASRSVTSVSNFDFMCQRRCRRGTVTMALPPLLGFWTSTVVWIYWTCNKFILFFNK